MQTLKSRAVDALLIIAALYNLAELLHLIDGPDWGGPASLALIVLVLLAANRIDLDGQR